MLNDDHIKDTLLPLILQSGLLLVSYQWQGRILQIFVEKNDLSSASIGDCTKLSKLLSPFLDTFIEKAYTLEVSTPGVNRLLKTWKDFVRFMNKDVKVTFNNQEDNCKKITVIGKLLQANKQDCFLTIQSSINKEFITIPFKDIVKARLHF